MDQTPQAHIAIICATRHEVHAVRGVFRGAARQVTCGGKQATIATLGEHSCVTVHSDPGFASMERMVGKVVEMFAPRLIINFGAAGGLSLPAGMMTLPVRVLQFSQPIGDRQINNLTISSQFLQDRFPSVCASTAVSCEEPVCDAEVADKLRSMGCDTVDCETFVAANVCANFSVPFIALRCVTDRANEATLTDYRANAKKVLADGAKMLADIANEAWSHFQR